MLVAFAAVLIAFGSVQLGFLGHDAGHRAVFRSTAANVALGAACWSLVLGIGFWYWNHRHLRHHAHVNDQEADPDLKWTRQRAPSRAQGRLILGGLYRMVVREFRAIARQRGLDASA
jgi:fatty acid desaturase